MGEKIIDIISKYQLAFVLVALLAGFVIPGAFRPLNPYNSAFLMIIMFATGLRISFSTYLKELRDWRTLLLAVSMMMIILPFLVTIPLKLFAPEWVLPFVIAAAMPTGLTAPAVISILGGRTSLALLISVSTSVIAPIAVPLMLRVLLGESVAINTVGMMSQIALVVLVPLALAGLIQWRAGEKRVKKFEVPLRLLNLAAFVLVIASVTAGSADDASVGTAQNLYGVGVDGIIITILMTVFWFGISWLAAAILAWRDRIDQLTVAFCLIYMNTTLGVWIADKFFPDTGIAPKLVAIFVATTIILPVFKVMMPKEKRGLFRRVYAVEQL
jgi:BASS family bile acid:Na+ symporter